MNPGKLEWIILVAMGFLLSMAATMFLMLLAKGNVSW